MIIRQQFIEKNFANEILNIKCNMPKTTDKLNLWRLAKQGFLFEIFQRSKESELILIEFYEYVHHIVQLRNINHVRQMMPIEHISGKVLVFDPSITLYDQIAFDVTQGFFDADDVPPPEFWLGVLNHKLYSFIPHDYFEVADMGIQHALGGSLEWLCI